MPFEFLDEVPTADVGFRAWGVTLEECFESAAAATLAMMLENRADLQPRERRPLHVQAESLDLALLRLLEEIVFYKDAENLFVGIDAVNVGRHGEQWEVTAIAVGEHIDAARHHLLGDVKAVTLHQLGVRQTETGWEATVVLDV